MEIRAEAAWWGGVPNLKNMFFNFILYKHVFYCSFWPEDSNTNYRKIPKRIVFLQLKSPWNLPLLQLKSPWNLPLISWKYWSLLAYSNRNEDTRITTLSSTLFSILKHFWTLFSIFFHILSISINFRVRLEPLIIVFVCWLNGLSVGISHPISRELSILRKKWRFMQNRIGLEACTGQLFLLHFFENKYFSQVIPFIKFSN